MKSIASLHENFISNARTPMIKGSLPIDPVKASLPVIPMNSWKKSQEHYVKKYDFRVVQHRNDFIKQLLNYEQDVGHHAKFIIEEDNVVLMLQTKNIKSVTELDKEYAKHADSVYKDVVLIPEQ
jgi:pterin-4a-carbinolamine dehydratase